MRVRWDKERGVVSNDGLKQLERAEFATRRGGDPDRLESSDRDLKVNERTSSSTATNTQTLHRRVRSQPAWSSLDWTRLAMTNASAD